MSQDANNSPTEWMDLKALRKYVSVSERTLRSWIHQPNNPLPAAQVGGKILVRRSVVDTWLERHAVKAAAVSCIVEEITASLMRAK